MRITWLIVATTIGFGTLARSAAASTTEDGAEIDGSETNSDPYELPRVRVDGGLGGMFGDGAGTFAMRGHAGVSAWHRSDDGFTALRLTGGLALGMDVADSQHAYATAAPFAELGLAYIRPRTTEHGARQATVFLRAEPVLITGTLNEHAVRVGAGVTLHGFPWLFPGLDHRSSSTSDNDDFTNVVLYSVGLPIVAAMNVRHIEVTSDLGMDGHRQIGFLLGFWGQ